MALIQRIKLESSAARREWKQLQEEPKKYSRETRESVTKASSDVETRTKRMTNAMKAAWAGVAAVVGSVVVRALTAVQRKMFELATDVEETASKFNITFGDQAETVDEFINTFGRLAGLTNQQGREMTATLGAVAQGFGASKDASAEFAVEVTRAAADMASFNNTDLPSMLQAIRSGLAGEIEPLRRYGIELSAANVEQKALAMTGKENAEQLDQQEKVYARLALIQEQAALQMGDLERTQNSLANQVRRLQGNLRQKADEMAVRWIPAMTKAVAAANALFASSTELAGAVSTARAEIEKLDRIDRAIDTVEQLQNRTNLSALENDRLREALELLQDEFPGYIRQTNAAGEAMSFYTDQLRAAVSEQRALQRAIETERLGELLERFQEGRAGGTRARAAQRQVAQALPGVRQRFEATRSMSLLSDQRREAERELDRMEDLLQRFGNQALTMEARTRQATEAIVNLFREGEDFNADDMIDAITATGTSFSEAQRLAAQLIATYIRLQGAQEDVAETERPEVPGSASDLPDGGVDIPTRLVTQEDVDRAQELLEKIDEAQTLAAQRSEAERRAMTEILRIQEEIEELERIGRVLGTESVEDQLASARERLEVTREELAAATELREKIRQTAESFEGLLPKQKVFAKELRDALTVEPDERSIFDLFEERGGEQFISAEALRSVGMTADEAERLAENLKKGKDEGEDLSDVLDSVATSIRSVTRFVDVFGDLSDEARLAADGIADIVDNIGQLAEAEGSLFSAENFPALVGAAAGVGSIIASIVSASEANREEMKRLRDALRASTRAYQEAIRSQFEGGRVGRGISEEQLERARAIVEEIRSLSSAERDRRQELLRELSELGIEPLEGAFDMASDLFGSISEAGVIEFGLDAGRIQKGDIRKLVDAILLGGDVPEAIADLLGTSDLSEILEGLNIHLPRGFQNFLEFLSQAEGGLGEFTNDVAGAAERVRFMEQFLGTEAPAAARAFIQSLLDVEGITPQFKSALEDLLAIDVSTEEGRAQFDEQIQALADRFAEGGEAMDGWLGSLDPAEFQQILELLFGYAEEFGQKLEEAGDEMADAVKSAAEKMQEASQNIRDAITFADRLGLSSNAIADIIVDNFQKLFEGEIPKVARNLLGNIRGLDLSSQQGQETLSKIIKQLMEAVLSGTTLTEFGLTEEQARKMLDALEGIEQSAGDTPESRFTSSVTNLRQLSFAQGSELVFLTIEANLTRMRILEQVRAASGILSGLLVAIRSRPPIGFEFPPNLSAAMSNITAPRTPSSTASEWAVHPNMSATFGDININGVVIPMDDFARFVGTQVERYIQDNT